MFRPMKLPASEQRRAIQIMVEGQPVLAREGDTLVAALLNAGVVPFRHTPVSGQARAPMCLMCVCFDCLGEGDGAPNGQSCMVEVRDGMQVRLQVGARPMGDSA